MSCTHLSSTMSCVHLSASPFGGKNSELPSGALIGESIQDVERPVYVMPPNQIISVEETNDFPSTNVVEDLSLDDIPTNAIDPISKLPQPILHHMLGFLQAQDTAPVAVLSKTWYQVWNTLPFIDFDGPVWALEHDKMRPWLPYVDSMLSHRKNQGVVVDKFRIGSGHLESFESYLDHWITTLRDLHVHDLCFRNYFYKDDYCTLPESILSVKSINSLELLRFRLDSFQGKEVNWPLLRKLHLKLTQLNDDVIHNIISNCVAIEDLKFEHCSGLEVIKISNLVKLQKFELEALDEFPKVEINIPSLQSFCYIDAAVKHCFSIASCTRLQTLVFSGPSITQGWFDKLFFMFPLLESLTVGECNKLVKINISSSNLKCFRLENCQKVVEANIDTPTLSTFVYIGTGALSWSLNASPQLQVNVTLLKSNYSKYPVRCTKVTNFLRMIGHFKIVRLGCCHQSLSFSREIKDNLIYSQCNLKSLLLDISVLSKQFTIDDATRLLDNLLWIYSQLENLSIYVGGKQLPPLELMYERLNSGEERLDCCDSVSVRCWRHFLEQVKLETVERDEAHRKGIYKKEKILKIKLKPREW